MASDVIISSKVLLDNILHYYPVQCYIPTCKYFFINKFGFHEVVKGVLTFWLYFWKDTFICVLSEFVYVIDVFSYCLQIRVRNFWF